MPVASRNTDFYTHCVLDKEHRMCVMYVKILRAYRDVKTERPIGKNLHREYFQISTKTPLIVITIIRFLDKITFINLNIIIEKYFILL